MASSESLELHDAEVILVAIDRQEGYAQLDFRLEDGQSSSVKLKGIRAFRCEDLTLQNVVSRVLRSSNADMSREGLKYWLQWVTSLSDADSWLSDERNTEWLTDCEVGVLELVVIEPSAGAQIVAVCERLEII